jgi:hypothetical protein
MIAAEHVRTACVRLSAELRAGDLTASGDLADLRAILAEAPRTAWPRLAVAFNEDQIESKLWLIDQVTRVLDPSEHRVVILGAWYGVLALIMDRVLARPPAEVVCIDLDAAACAMATRLMALVGSRPSVCCADILDLDHAALAVGRPTVFVNTSCEHLTDFDGWRARVPAGARLVLQSNDHVGCSEHVNCAPDVDAFARQARLSQTSYRGTLPLAKFRRFMLIGQA